MRLERTSCLKEIAVFLNTSGAHDVIPSGPMLTTPLVSLAGASEYCPTSQIMQALADA